MPKFEVTITEILTKTVTVEAEDEDEAFWKVCDDWRDGEHVLYPEDFLCAEFEVRHDGYISVYDDNGFFKKCIKG